MTKRTYLFLMLILTTVLSSCAMTSGPTAEGNAVTLLPGSPPSPTASGSSLTATTSTEPTARPPSVDRITESTLSSIPTCPKSGMQTTPDLGFGILGTIVYKKDLEGGLYTVGGNPLMHSKLPVSGDQEYFVFGFSPDGNWLASSPEVLSETNEIVFRTPTIILLSADGERVEKTISIEGFSNELSAGYRFLGFSGQSYWINNTTIYTTLFSANTDSNSPGSIDELPEVLDPFAAVWRDDLLKALPEGAKSFTKGISPDMTRILYMDGDGLSLNRLDSGAEIWHDKDLFAGFGSRMVWSPDSEVVAFSNLYESLNSRTVVVISRDGEARSIVGPGMVLSKLTTIDLRWSPDGHYLALLAWKETAEDKNLSVFIYDSEAKRYISQCPIAASTSRNPKIFWSPDNQFLGYAALDYPLVIMNVQSGELFQLADNARMVGWSEKFPTLWP